MSFQMVLLPTQPSSSMLSSFGTMSFQMVLLLVNLVVAGGQVLELCHSRWFYYRAGHRACVYAFWNYVIPDGSTTYQGS